MKPMRSLRSFSALVLALVLVASARPAFAGDDAARRAAFAEGRRAIETERWPDALAIYTRLWSEQRTFDVALQLGLVEINLRKHRDAAEHLAFGIRNLPPKESQAIADRAHKLLELAEREVGKLEIIVARPGAEVRVDGRPVGSSPLDDAMYMEPGTHAVEVLVNGSVRGRQEFVMKAGEQKRVALEIGEKLEHGAVPAAGITPSAGPPAAAPKADPGRSPPADAGGKDMVPVYATGAGAVVGIGVGVTFLILAAGIDADKDDALARFPEPQPCANNTPHVSECAEIEDLAADARTYRTIGYVSLGIGALAAGAAVVLLAMPDKPAGSNASAKKAGRWITVAPTISPHNFGASVVGAF